MLAIIGSAGASGAFLLRALQNAEVPCRALVHDAAGAERATQAGAAEVAMIELSSVDSIASALRGVTAAYMIPPSMNPMETNFALNALRAAESTGVPRFVYVSVIHPHTPSMLHHMRKAAAEVAIRNSTLEWTILQPAIYGQMFCRMFAGGTGTALVPFNVDSVMSVIDLRELAEVAVKVLTQTGHDGATYELSSTRGTVSDLIRVAGRARGIELVARRIPPSEAPLPPRFNSNLQASADLRAMFAEYDNHGLRGNNTVLRQLIGREPADIAAIANSAFTFQI